MQSNNLFRLLENGSLNKNFKATSNHRLQDAHFKQPAHDNATTNKTRSDKAENIKNSRISFGNYTDLFNNHKNKSVEVVSRQILFFIIGL